LEGLLNQGIPTNEALDLMHQLGNQLTEIDVLLTYEDVLGNVIAKNEILS